MVGVYSAEHGSRLRTSEKWSVVMKGVIVVILGTLGYIMIGVALAGMG